MPEGVHALLQLTGVGLVLTLGIPVAQPVHATSVPTLSKEGLVGYTRFFVRMFFSLHSSNQS